MNAVKTPNDAPKTSTSSFNEKFAIFREKGISKKRRAPLNTCKAMAPVVISVKNPPVMASVLRNFSWRPPVSAINTALRDGMRIAIRGNVE
jgi:hypothetical protein